MVIKELPAKDVRAARQLPREDNVLKVENATKVYKLRTGLGRFTAFKAVDNASFGIERGQTTAIVGESGSGKSTLARMVLGLVPTDSGRIVFDGMDISNFNRRQIFAYRRDVQPIFQNPYSSLDPRYSVYRTIEEPLRVHRIGDQTHRDRKVRRLLDQVCLPSGFMNRYPNELSGGERQRVAIARALALDPKIVVCDEAVSALDALVQKQILNLLTELQSHLALTYLFIAHDLAIVHQFANHVCVMKQGCLVETGNTELVFEAPRHDHTKALLSAIPGARAAAPPPAS